MYYFFLVYKHTNDDVFADFPKIDEEEPKNDIFTRDDIRFYQFDTARGGYHQLLCHKLLSYFRMSKPGEELQFAYLKIGKISSTKK